MEAEDADGDADDIYSFDSDEEDQEDDPVEAPIPNSWNQDFSWKPPQECHLLDGERPRATHMCGTLF
jgi:hypothetical protein